MTYLEKSTKKVPSILEKFVKKRQGKEEPGHVATLHSFEETLLDTVDLSLKYPSGLFE